jgi:ABC-type sugar transport system permease subunit
MGLHRQQIGGYPWIVPVAAIWHLFVVFLSLSAFAWIAGMDDFFNLGVNPQYFVAAVCLIPAILAAYSTVAMFLHQNNGRYVALIINFTGAALSVGYLFHLWDVYIGIDQLAYALLDNAQWMLGIALGYGLFWLAGRFDEDSDIARYLELAGVGVAMLALVILLWTSDLLGAVSHILDQYTETRTWVVTLMALAFAVVTYFVLHQGEYFGETTGQQEAWQGWLMLSPNILGFMLFFAGPLLLSFYLSFTNAQVGQVPDFIGISNYRDILGLQIKEVNETHRNPQNALDIGYTVLTDFNVGDTNYVLGAEDRGFWISLRNTIVFCLMLIPLSTIPALILSIVLNSKIPGVKFFRAVYFLPSVAAVVGTALIWRWLYNPTIGFFNHFITQGVDFLNSLGMGLSDPEINWLTDSGVMLFAVVLLSAWQVVGFNTVLFLAGLQGIPDILYEAAYVDGANRWQQFRNVTLPLLAPTTFFVIITTVITGLQVFNEPYALITVRPLPDAATTSVYYLYFQGFFRFQFGYASAIAWLLFALIFSITLLQFRLRRAGAYDN